jgi:hypothetical protein
MEKKINFWVGPFFEFLCPSIPLSVFPTKLPGAGRQQAGSPWVLGSELMSLLVWSRTSLSLGLELVVPGAAGLELIVCLERLVWSMGLSGLGKRAKWSAVGDKACL